jgi:hypothetical protein
MDPIALPDCRHSWTFTVSPAADSAAVAAALPALLATAEAKGISTVTLAACGALPVQERTQFIMLGLLSIDEQPDVDDGPAVARLLASA